MREQVLLIVMLGLTSMILTRTSLVTGRKLHTSVVSTASRGIGLEFARQLLLQPDSVVYAVCRSEEIPNDLVELRQKYSDNRLKVIGGVDLEDASSIEDGYRRIAAECKEVDLLINCAGILGDNSAEQPGPERSILKVDSEWLQKTMSVNFMSHVLMTQGIAPLMKRRAKKGETLSDDETTKIVNISARVGSVSDNGLGGWLSYRCSKSALNQFTKTASIELKRHHCAVLSMHPGTTDTGLSKPFQKGLPAGQLMSTQEAVSKMLHVIRGASIEDTGSFYDYAGKTIEW